MQPTPSLGKNIFHSSDYTNNMDVQLILCVCVWGGGGGGAVTISTGAHIVRQAVQYLSHDSNTSTSLTHHCKHTG